MTHPTLTDASYRLALLEFYASRGLRVHPIWWLGPDGRCACPDPHCREQNWGKHPILGGWQHVATTDVEQLRAWHERYPLCNWAWAIDGDTYVLDCDPRNGGPRTEHWVSDLRALGLPEPPPSLFQVSGSGGLHAAYRVTGYEPKGNDTLVLEDGTEVAGVNVKGAGGYVLVAPSNHKSGGVYSWFPAGRWLDPVPWPELDVFLQRGPSRPSRASGGGSGSLVDPGPGEDFLEKWYREAGTVANGNQRGWLLSGLGWMRKRNRSAVEMMALGWQVAQRLVVFDASEPWTEHHVADLVRDTRERYTAELDGNAVVPAWRPVVLQGGGDSNGGGTVETNGSGELAEVVQLRVPAQVVDNRASDRANAQDLAAIFGNRLLWTPQVGWLVWDGKRWAIDELRAVDALVGELADELDGRRATDPNGAQTLEQRVRRLESTGGRTACLDYAAHALAVSYDDLDQRPWLLNCGSKTLDLRTGKTKDPDPADRLTRWCPTEYVEGTQSELLNEYWRTFVPDEKHREVLLRVLGACLVGGNDTRNLICLLGPTTTGKSQLASALQAALGDYVGIGGASIFRGNLDDRPRTDLLKLLPTRVALLEEAGHAWELHADRVKAVTGGGTLSARGMRSNAYLERVPEFTPVVIANEMPRVKRSDAAVLQRLVVIRFDQRPEKEDVSKRAAFLEDPAVQQALLVELVAGCLRAQKLGATAADLPHQFQVDRARAFEDLDDVKQVLEQLKEDDLLVYEEGLSAHSSLTTGQLYKLYDRYVREYGDHEQQREKLGRNQFIARIPALGYEVSRSGGSRVVGWKTVDPAITWKP